MRLYSITAGAAGMYCGSCIRDNALAAELRRQGHEVLLIPTYTPIRTDEDDVSEHKVFFGGVSVYLEQHSNLFRRAPRWLDRLWDAPLVLRLLSRMSISTDPHLLGELTVSVLRGQDGPQQKELAKLLDWLATQPRPDVVTLHSSLFLQTAAPIKRALGCTVCCTLQGEDLFLDGLDEPYRSRTFALIRGYVDEVDAFIAVSHYYADYMAGYLGIPRGKIHVVPLGINLNGYPDAPPQHDAAHAFTVGYFARVTPEKGLLRLCEAYRLLRKEFGLPPSRLEVAGYMGAEHRSYLRQVEAKMKSWGLAEEFRYHGVLSREEKIRFLSGLDVLSVPSSYAEPKGLYLLEAMACGVPVVQPRLGAFPEVVERTGGGILVEPENVESLAAGIRRLWQNRQFAAELGRAGYAGVRQHYSVERMAGRAVAVYNEVLAARRACATAVGR